MKMPFQISSNLTVSAMVFVGLILDDLFGTELNIVIWRVTKEVEIHFVFVVNSTNLFLGQLAVEREKRVDGQLEIL